MPEYEERLILFLDILGFRKIVEKTTKDARTLEALLRAIDMIREMEETDYELRGSKRVSQFSDSIVVSYALGEESAAFSLVNEMALTITELAYRGFLMRGAITVGKLVHTDEYLVGPAMVRAYEMESKRAVFPRVLIDRRVLTAAKRYHAEHHSPGEEAQFVRDFMTKDPLDGQYYFDYVSFDSVVADVGGEVHLYGQYLLSLATMLRSGLRDRDPKVQAKYLWLHRQFVDAVDLLALEPEDGQFCNDNPELCALARGLPRMERLAASAASTVRAARLPAPLANAARASGRGRATPRSRNRTPKPARRG